MDEGSGSESFQRVSAEVYEVVSASFLLENRERFERSKVPVYLVRAQAPGSYQVEPVALGAVAADPSRWQAERFVLARQWTASPEPLREVGPPPPKDDAFFIRWNELLALPPEQRVAELRGARRVLVEGIRSEADPAARVEIAAKLTETAFLVNRASMGLQSYSAAADQALVEETVKVIHSVVALIEATPNAVALFRTLESPSASQTLDHIVRVFTLTTGFLLHYNALHQKGLIARLRGAFPGVYREAYRRLLPHLSDSLASSDNLVRLPALDPGRIRVQALGALMHDIGKAHDLDYFETGVTYDREKIQRHPVLGSGLFLRTYGNGYEEARYIIGDHHNYLFHPEGYGLTRWERARAGRPVPPAKCGVADTLEAWTSGQALTFLPVEVCSLIDVYDALTDPSRVYKDPLTPAEAVAFLEREFVAAKKADPVLFDLLVDYLKSLGVDLPAPAGFQAKATHRPR